MKLRALQNCTVNLPGIGLVFVTGPETGASGEVVPGKVVEVPDDFVIHPDVFEIVTPPAGGKPRWAQQPVLRPPARNPEPTQGTK